MSDGITMGASSTFDRLMTSMHKQKGGASSSTRLQPQLTSSSLGLTRPLGAAGDISDMFAGVMNGLDELRRDMTKRIDQVDERAHHGRESLKDELTHVKSQARFDQAQLIRNTDQCLAESLAQANKESEEREARMTREIERLLNDHDNTYAQTMTGLEKRLDAKSDLMMRKLDAILNGSSWQEHSNSRERSRHANVGDGTGNSARAQQGSRTNYEHRNKERPRAAPQRPGWTNPVPPEADATPGTRLPTVPQVSSVPDLTTVSQDTTIYASMFEPLNRSLETFITKLSKSTERGERSRRTLKKPKSYKDESDGCIDTWIEVMKLHFEEENLSKKQECSALTSNLEGTALNCVMAKRANERDSARKIFDILLNRFGSGVQGHQAMVKFEKRRQRDEESIDKFLDDLELLRRRSNPEERISERNLAIASKFMDGVRSEELKTMLATHFTLSLDQVPTPDDLRMKSREYLLIKPRAQNRYSNYGNYSGTNTGANSSWYKPRDDMDKRRSCANCGSMDHHVSACSTYKQNMKAIGYFLEDADATDEDHEEYVRGLIMKYGPRCFFCNLEGHFKSDCTQFWVAVADAKHPRHVDRIYIGKEELKVRRIGHNAMLEQDAVHIGCEADLAAHVLDVQGRQLSVKGLLDTGAVVSVMPVKTWTDMGFERSDLIPTNIRLAAANQGAIYVAGRTPIISLQLGGRHLWMSFLVVENLDESDQFILGRDFVRNFDVTIHLNDGLIRIKDPERKYEKRPLNKILINQAKVPIFLDRKIRLKPNQAVVATFRMRNLNELSNDRQVCLVPNPNSKSSAILGRSFSLTQSGLCVSVLLNTEATTVTIQRGKKLGYALPLNTDFLSVENLKKFDVTKCPLHANQECIMKRVNELKSSRKLFSMKSETDDGLSSCSNFPERPTEAELAANKPVLPEIEHLKGKISDKELDSLRAVLNRNADVFSKHKADIGCCNFVEHEIEIEEGSVPHREGARRMTPNKSEACRKEIEMLMEYDMIEPSKSPWDCGVVMAKKKGGQLRFCCDFRYLNAVTIKDAYPIPRIDESLSKLGDAKFFTTLDLGSAFWQVPLRKQDREKTGFACELGLFQWKRMPFGLCNATATFQRLMAQALTSVTKKYGNLIMCYVDDVVIATPTLEDHIERLEEVFSCMKQAGLKCKPSKCEILRDSIKYLGRLVDKHGVRPDPEAVEAVLTWKAPKTDTQLMSFLGFAIYYREFIKGYADKIYPMQRLMRNKGKKFTWTDEAQVSFENIKRELCEAPVLGMPTEKGIFVLDTDASVVAISGILHQEQEWNGRTVLRPIAYGSKVLSDTEMKYGAPKAEMFAVITFVEKYRAYLGSAPFKLRVDNRALAWLKTYSMDQSYIGRWIVRLDGYHMIIEHRTRDKHQNADSLSKKTEFYERLEEKQANQSEIKDGFSFLDKETYDKLPLTRWLDKSGHPIPGHPDLPVETAAEIKLLARGEPVPLDLLVRSNLVQQELTRLGINSMALLNKTVNVAPDVMGKLRDLLDREVDRHDREWMETMQRLTVTERTEKRPVSIRSRGVERDCRSIVNQLVSSMPKEVLLRTSFTEYGTLNQNQTTEEVRIRSKSSFTRRVHFTDAKEEYEPSPDCSSVDETMSGESDIFEPVKDDSSEESDTFEPVQDDLSGERLTRPPRGKILSGESGSKRPMDRVLSGESRNISNNL